jgi:hypothetical protein
MVIRGKAEKHRCTPHDESVVESGLVRFAIGYIAQALYSSQRVGVCSTDPQARHRHPPYWK